MAAEIVIPRLGWSMEEGTFVAWLRKAGERIEPGDVLFELEGEKAVQEIEAVDGGILHIPANGPAEGTVVKVGSIVGYLLAEGEAPPEPADVAPTVPKTESKCEGVSIPVTTASPAMRRMARERGISIEELAGSGPGGRILAADLHRGTTASAIGTSAPGRPKSSPRARRVARELGIDWTRLSGTGMRGRIRERDVREAATGERKPRPKFVADPTSKRIPVTTRRRVIAERMSTSAQQTAPVTLYMAVDATRLMKLRGELKQSGGEPVPSYQDMILQLVGKTLVEHPLLGAIWDETSMIVPTEEGMHVGIAVDTPEGLLVPVVRNVLRKSLQEIATESRRLIEQARGGRLAASEMQGGVFTVTNLGAYGVEYFSPIINLPQTAILGLGTIRSTAVGLDDGALVSQPQLHLSLTFDHRVVDGGPAAKFLQDLAGRIANP